MGVALENRMNNQELWEAGFVVSRGWGDPWFPWKDVIGLFPVGWQGTRIHFSGNRKELCLVPLIRSDLPVGPDLQQPSREGNLPSGI